MLKRIIALAVVLSCSAVVLADYPADRQAALELVKAGKDAEALAAFTKMADATALEGQKSDALEQAALCANRLKKYDEAVELAKRITPIQMSKAVQMCLMQENRKYDELIAAFKGEDISNWPDKAAGLAGCCRGRAYMLARDGKAAEADLKKAVETLGEGYVRDETRLLLGETYATLLNDDAQALATFTDGIAKSQDAYGWIRLTCITSSSGILARQKKFGEALAILGKVDSSAMKGVWKYNFILAYADVYAAQGQKAEAIAKLNEGLAGKDVAEWQKPMFEQRLKALQPDAK